VKQIFLFFLVSICALAGAADSFDAHCGNIAILQRRDVQNEVGITSAQRDQMNKYADANRAKLVAYQKKLNGKTPDRDVVNGYMLELKSDVDRVLTPAQLKRLRELSLQWAGLLGLMDKVVATKVGMSDAQYTKYRQTFMDGQSVVSKINSQIKEALKPLGEKYDKLFAPYKGHEKEHQAEIKKLLQDFEKEAQPIRQRYAPQVQAITKETQQKMMAILTAQQIAAWKNLEGNKYVPPKGKS